MGNNAIPNGVFDHPSMCEVLALIAFKSDVSESHDIIGFHVLFIGFCFLVFEVHIGNGNNLVRAVRTIVLFGLLLILVA